MDNAQNFDSYNNKFSFKSNMVRNISLTICISGETLLYAQIGPMTRNFPC
jgi:hypothetical protein